MGTVSDLYATLTRTPYVIPISDGSGSLNDWVDTFVNPMTTDQDIVVATIGGVPGRLGVGAIGTVLTVGSSGLIDWETPTGGFVNPMTTSQDLIVGGLAGAPARLGVGSVGQVLTVGSGGIVDWETPSATVIGANPTASVGLSAVNGVATTYMRSDGAPALSQAIIPTWTGAHVFEASLTVGKAGGTTGFVNFKGTTSGTVTLSVADAAGTNTFKLPATAGSNTNVLATDGSGNLFWQAAAAGSGTINSGTANRVAYYAATGTTISGTPAITVDATTTAIALQTTARASGVVPYLTVTAPADTAQTAGTESIGVSFLGAIRQHASNTAITSQREYVFAAPTYSFASATGTITNAATVAITAAPIVGTNAAITNTMALWVQLGSIGTGPAGTIATIRNPSGAGGLELTASGTNQNITFITSGTGQVVPCTTATLPATLFSTALFATYGTTQANTAHAAIIYTATAGNGGELYLGHARGTFASPSATQSGDTLGRIAFVGYTTALTGATALIRAEATETWTGSVSGNKIIFATTLSTTNTRSDCVVIDNDGSLKCIRPLGAIGYGVGAGASVNQASSRTTGVTINNVCGLIGLVSAAGSATPATFTVTNSAVATTDTILVSQRSGTDKYIILVTAVAAGSFNITCYTTGGTTTETPGFSFSVIKSVTT